jgi:hypothetical protein
MGLREKHPVYSKPLILFFYEGSPFNNFKISGPEKNIWGGSLCHLTAHQMRDVAPNLWWER